MPINTHCLASPGYQNDLGDELTASLSVFDMNVTAIALIPLAWSDYNKASFF